VLLGKPLFPGRNVVHQLELITDLLGTPSLEVINKVRPRAAAGECCHNRVAGTAPPSAFLAVLMLRTRSSVLGNAHVKRVTLPKRAGAQ
jgi:hypothetical protein